MDSPINKAVLELDGRLGRAWEAKPRLALPLCPHSAAALTALAAARQHACVLVVTDSPKALDITHRNLLTLDDANTVRSLYYPAWDALPSADEEPDPEIMGHRFSVLDALASSQEKPIVLALSIQGLMQRTPSKKRLAATSVRLTCGDEQDPHALALQLEQTGYIFAPEVQDKSQAALKGGILDVWPSPSDWPARIEFFGTEIDSMRKFDPFTQRSVERIDTVLIPTATEWMETGSKMGTLFDYLPASCAIIWHDVEGIEAHAAGHQALAIDVGAAEAVISLEDADKKSRRKCRHQIRFTAEALPPEESSPLPRFEPSPAVAAAPGSTFLPDMAEAARSELLGKLATAADDGHAVHLYFDTLGTREHFLDIHRKECDARIQMHNGVLADGISCPQLNLVVVAESDLYGLRKEQVRRYDPTTGRARSQRGEGSRISDFQDIDVDDLVVHVDHGIGRYVGLQEITFDGQQQEVMAIEYADSGKLYVPTSHAHLLSRYVGVGGKRVRLHKLGGKRWASNKESAAASVRDLAAGLLDVQAARDMLRGHPFAADTTWQHEFEKAFPFQETADQESVIRAVKIDMESHRPMDRLICGDAGYGKTEVAMRAAFKAVMEAKQVAVLVPTTVLAQQHFRTFSERMAGYPITIRVLSRFQSAGQRAASLAGMKEGTVDIAIGTHAIVQKDVEFKDIGLVVIDEEQRFGVAHKERLKTLKKLVDVLTLSATPIPRTLYMSMTGVRDMSLLRTPPRERMAIETIVVKDSEKVVRDAIVREVGRGGQVFYLYNRVMTIELAQRRLEALCPDVRIERAHGQMKPGELAAVMRRFVDGEFDVLLCTTIIESGMDIPRANTILIDRADRFGLADLYQLRGRVGRSNRKAYAYLLLPAHGWIDSDARERMKAIRKFSDLGAGFNLALRDLELRGAGNILGAAQSGHIAAVGFGLYCQLLKRSIARMKGETPPRLVETEVSLDFIDLSPSASGDGGACLPYDYIDDEPLRVATYRRIAELSEPAELDQLRDELKDRFGPMPPTLHRLMLVADIRLAAAMRAIQRVDVRGRKLMLMRNDSYLMQGTRHPQLRTVDPTERLSEILTHLHDKT